MDKALRFIDDFENYPTYRMYFHRNVKSPFYRDKFVVPWQLEENRKEKKEAK